MFNCVQKCFLILSLSIFSFLSAMDTSKEEKLSNVYSQQKPISIFSKKLPPPDGSNLEQIERERQKKDINDHLEKEQLQNIKSILLKDFNADPNLFKIGFLKEPVICVAAEHNDIELIKLLLERGVDINTNNDYENTALYTSVSKGNDFLREYLLQKGANPNISSYLMTPLENAMFHKDASAIKSLIQYNAGVDPKIATNLIKDTDFNLKKEYYSHISTVLLVLKKCKRILYNNRDLRFLILSYLSEYHCHPGLYKELLNRKCALKSFALHVIDGHTRIVQDILQIKNKDNKNILELFPSIASLNQKLLEDSAEFKEKYFDIFAITKDNLALEILKRYAFEYEYKSLIPEDIVAFK